MSKKDVWLNEIYSQTFRKRISSRSINSANRVTSSTVCRTLVRLATDWINDSRKPIKRDFFIPKIGLSESCQKKTEFLHFLETHKTIGNIGGRGGIRTHDRIAPTPDFESGAFNHSATLPAESVLIKTSKLRAVNLNPVNNPRLTIPRRFSNVVTRSIKN